MRKCGTKSFFKPSLVIVVDSGKRVVELHDDSIVALLSECETIEHAAMPGFRYSVADLFGALRRG